MNRCNKISEEKMSREGLRNKDELFQNANVMKMKAQYLILNCPSGKSIINEYKDFSGTFYTYFRFLLLNFSDSINEFNINDTSKLNNVQFEVINCAFKKLEELLKRDIKDKKKNNDYLIIMAEIAGIIDGCKHRLIKKNSHKDFQMTSLEIVSFLNKIFSKCLEIDKDLKDSYKSFK